MVKMGSNEDQDRKIVLEFSHLLEKSKQLFNGLRCLSLCAKSSTQIQLTVDPLQGFAAVWPSTVVQLFRKDIRCLHKTVEVPATASSSFRLQVRTEAMADRGDS